MNILHVSPSFYPATFWGGPIFSTKMICDEVANRPGVSLVVLTTDSAGPKVAERVVPGSARDLGYHVDFARRIAGHSISPALIWRLWSMARQADVIHLTGTYSFPTLPALMIARVFGKPVVWSPRGAIQATAEWAQSPRRRVKRLFHKVAALCAARNVTVHVTAQEEAQPCAAALPGLEIVTIPNAVAMPDLGESRARSGSVLGLMYLGRLHPKKGLDRLLDALAKLPKYVELDVYGSGEAEYVAHIRNRCTAFGSRVRLHGSVEGEAKAKAFARADMFVLPTYSENFGIVIAEALAHGVPVLTTTATPWKQLEAKGCGMLIDPVDGDIAGAVLLMSGRDMRGMGALGRQWMAADYSAAAIGDAFHALYADLVAKKQVLTHAR